MLHIRITVPDHLCEAVKATLFQQEFAVNLATYPNASLSPPGDVMTCDIPREAASRLLEELSAAGLATQGSIAVESIDTVLSTASADAEKRAPGFGSDAVVWEEVTARTSEDATLSGSFLVFMIVATLISGVAVILDSSILVVGAMVVGPEFGPLAGLSVALVQRKVQQAIQSITALVVGFPVGIALVMIGTWLLNQMGRLPNELDSAHRPFTGFIAKPDEFTIIVALLAGVVGMLSLTSAKSGPLIGVLVSVTTIPAAGNLGVAMAIGQWDDAFGSAVQLLVNILCLVIGSATTLVVQQELQRRRTVRLESG